MTRTTAAKGMFPTEDGRIGFADRATHEPSPQAVSAVPVGVPLRVVRIPLARGLINFDDHTTWPRSPTGEA